MERKIFILICLLAIILPGKVVKCQKTLDTEYIYLHNSLVGEEKFIVDNNYSIINYSRDLPIEKSKIIQRELYLAIDSIENFGDGYICPALTKESIQNICSILGRDSVYISFTKRLYMENNTEVWTSNSITIKLREDIKIADFLKKNNIAYKTINVLGENEYSIYLNDVIDVTFDLCNELNEDGQIEYACPNFNFFIEDDEQINVYEQDNDINCVITNIESAWNLSTGTNVIVAILDIQKKVFDVYTNLNFLRS